MAKSKSRKTTTASTRAEPLDAEAAAKVEAVMTRAAKSPVSPAKELWVPPRPTTVSALSASLSKSIDHEAHRSVPRTRAASRNEARSSVLPQVRVSDELAASFAEYIATEGVSAADAIREFVTECLARREATQTKAGKPRKEK